jgi:photosystem II stability/assembly factor-like uncharacterized protein
MSRIRLPHLAALVLAGALVAIAAPRLRERLAREGGEREVEHAPSDWFYAQRAERDGSLDPARWEAAMQQAGVERAGAERAARSARAGSTAGSLAWQQAGPFNIGGRVTALAVDGGTIYLGSANGGVWKSANAGVNWTCVTDGGSIMSVGALASDPSTPGTIWCGTGEANGSVDSYDGNGLWRSADAGASWNPAGLASTARIARIVVDPANPNHVLVAAMGRQFSSGPDRGLYRTLDGGANWSKVLFVNDSTGVTDIAINPVHPDTMYCATWERLRRTTYRRASGPGSGIWRSVDRGATWARLSSGLPTPTDSVGRIALAVSPSRPGTVYAQIANGASLGYTGLGFWRSTDGGDHWSRRDAGGTFVNSFGGSPGFAWYFGAMGADPALPDRVYALGVSLIRSDDGGISWSDLTGSAHVDQHAIWIDPANGAHILLGNDGGFFSTTTGSAWTGTADLPISQFYAGDVDQTNPARLFGGLQDNNTVMTTGGAASWFATFGGDGFWTLSDPVTPNVVFMEYQYCSQGGGFVRSTSGGPSPAGTTGWVSSDRFGWSTPIAMNPLNHNVLISGSQYVYRSTNNGVNWSKPSVQNLTTNPVSQLVYGCITTVAISNADTSVYYAGTDDGKVWRSTDRGANWTDVSAGLPGRWVTRVTPDPADPHAVYVTESGFTADVQSALVFRSPDRGATWSNISANLPNAPANDLVVDPADPQTLFLATDVGVWMSRNRGAGWTPLGVGMPLQVVADLTLATTPRKLFAFTHGRSAWWLDLAALPAGVPANGLPPALALSAPWPNPAHGAVRMTLELARDAVAEVTIYDVLGRRVSTPQEGPLAAGRHAIVWDGRDARGARARAGVYFVSARSEGAIRTQRIVLAD